MELAVNWRRGIHLLTGLAAFLLVLAMSGPIWDAAAGGVVALLAILLQARINARLREISTTQPAGFRQDDPRPPPDHHSVP